MGSRTKGRNFFVAMAILTALGGCLSPGSSCDSVTRFVTVSNETPDSVSLHISVANHTEVVEAHANQTAQSGPITLTPGRYTLTATSASWGTTQGEWIASCGWDGGIVTVRNDGLHFVQLVTNR